MARKKGLSYKKHYYSSARRNRHKFKSGDAILHDQQDSEDANLPKEHNCTATTQGNSQSHVTEDHSFLSAGQPASSKIVPESVSRMATLTESEEINPIGVNYSVNDFPHEKQQDLQVSVPTTDVPKEDLTRCSPTPSQQSPDLEPTGHVTLCDSLHTLTGKHIVDLSYVIEQVAYLMKNMCCKNIDAQPVLMSERKIGLCSQLKFKCSNCGSFRFLSTTKFLGNLGRRCSDTEDSKLSLNDLAVQAFMTVGGGYACMVDALSIIGIRPMSEKTFYSHEQRVQKLFEEQHLESALAKGKEGKTRRQKLSTAQSISSVQPVGDSAPAIIDK